MNYYDEIKNELVNNEINRKIKNYSINRSDLNTYYNVGKMLSEAGKHYGEGIIKEYSKRLTEDLGKGYTETNLKYFRQFYYFSKSHTMCDDLIWPHYRTLLPLKNEKEIEYYIYICKNQRLSVRMLKIKIKNKEYDRLPESTKNKYIFKDKSKIKDLVPNPILIKNKKIMNIIVL